MTTDGMKAPEPITEHSLSGKQTLGHFRLLSLLGKGGMGEVYLAEDTRLGRKVALKLLPEQFMKDADRVRRFEQEARAASALNHPNIITIYDIGEVGGAHFIATEFIEGETLRRRMAGAPMKLHTALEVTAQAASALAAAHAAGIVHRDIKPENIMLRPDGYVKVLDFGLAKLTESHSSPFDTKAPTITGAGTESGVVMGTVRYMSPEQARGEKVDERSDIFSLGVVLYEIVAGRSPFEGATAVEVMAAILEREPLPLQRYARDVPETLEWIVTKSLQKDREERYQTVKDLALDLKNLKQRLELQAELERAGERESGERRKGEGERSGSGNIRSSASSPAVAPLTAETAVRATSSAEYLISEIKRHKRGVAVTLAALLIVAAAIIAWAFLLRQKSESSQSLMPRELSRFTFDAGLQSEPTWSPDGKFIAYSSDRKGNFDIYVRPIGEGNPIQVTNSPAHDWQPDFSPDGQHIVFRSERDGGGLFVVPITGGNERKISSFGYRPRWSPDGSRILFYSSGIRVRETSKVYVVALDGSPPREVLADFLNGFGYSSFRYVAWHPDGQRLSVWGRHKQFGQSFWTASLTDGTAVRSELASEVEQQLKAAAVNFEEFLWSPSRRALYFQGVTHGVTNLWKVSVDAQTLRWIAGPERLTTGPGPDTNLSLSADGKKLAFTTRAETTRIWSLPFDAASGRIKGAGQPITSVGINSWQFDLSHDGQKLAFIIERPGKRELWVKSLVDGSETLVGGGDNFSRAVPSWSRDGAYLSYGRARPTDAERMQLEPSIVLWPTAGGDEQVLTSPATGTPSAPAIAGNGDWSADGKWILGVSNRATPERTLIWLLPISAAPHAETQARVIASDPEYGFWQTRFSPDDRWICFNAIKATDAMVSTIGVVSATSGQWQHITEGKYWDDKPRWSPDGKTIYFLSSRGGFFNVWGIRFDPVNGKPLGEPFRVTAFESPGKMVSPLIGSMQISLAATRLALPIMEVSGSIWILENVDR